jgi:hypothetical protein
VILFLLFQYSYGSYYCYCDIIVSVHIRLPSYPLDNFFNAFRWIGSLMYTIWIRGHL